MEDTWAIDDRLRATRPTVSFEFFPPADAAGAYTLLDTVASLRELQPDWVSVTYGATGATRERTFDAVRAIKRHGGVPTMGHLTVAGQSRADVEEALASYVELGVDHILALRGDMPGGARETFVPHPQGIATATELVRLVRSYGDFVVGVAAFPDGHPAQFDLDLDARILLDKQEAGASFAVTQLFFSAESYVALVDRFLSIGGTMPIVAGIMPVTNIGQIKRFEEMSGVAMPSDLVALLRKAEGNPERLREVGIAWMTDLCSELIAAGAPGLQFFTLNRSKSTRAIVERLGPTVLERLPSLGTGEFAP